MRRKEYQANGGKSTCALSFGSVTEAMRAQSVLEHAAIRAEVIQKDSSAAGCAYAVLVDCLQEGNARTVLRSAGIRPRR